MSSQGPSCEELLQEWRERRTALREQHLLTTEPLGRHDAPTPDADRLLARLDDLRKTMQARGCEEPTE